MLVAARDDAGPLLGREAETELLGSLLDGIQSSGRALVLRGEPGIGKSRLLGEAVALARECDIAVLSTSGMQSEARLAFASLHQLLRPVRARAAGLSPAQRAALDAAFGLTDSAAPEHFRIAMAVLDLLSEAAAEVPLLLVAEDAHWLDPPSADVLAFVARRLESDPIVLLAATRDGYPSPLVDAGLPEHPLGALDPPVAAKLLDESAQEVTPADRNRILREAAGNPLALRELPISVRREAHDTAAEPLHLTARLERAFSARVSELPSETRLLLLVASLSDQPDVSEVLDGGTAVAGTPMTLEMLEPAAQAGIVELDVRSVRFRHPLMRSAVRQGASVAQRRYAHHALADILRADPDRRVWHRAALLTGAHEDVALELEEAGRRARRRGALHVAISALRRAAELTDPAHRGRRLLSAGELAVELGQPQLAAPLLREVGERSAPVERALATWI